jgi:predicted DNA-binding protein (UPF0251 family)
MTAKEYRKILDQLGLTQGEAAKTLGVSLRTAHGYANSSPIPEPMAKLLTHMLKEQRKRK